MTHRYLPWNSEEQLADILAMQRDALDAQIAALRATQDLETQEGRAAALLCEYLVSGSAKKAAEWAKSLGWKLPNPNPNGEKPTLEYTSKLVLEIVKAPPAGVSIALATLCRRVFSTQT